MKKTLFTALLLLVTGINTVSAQTSASTIESKKQSLFYNGDTKNAPYRIPAIATLKNGKVLAIADYRPGKNDVGGGEVDIYAKVGTKNADGSYSWTPDTNHPASSNLQRIADGTNNYAYGDAAVVVDRVSGDVLVICVAGKQVFSEGTSSKHNEMARIVAKFNETSGSLTWNSPEEVTEKFFANELKSAYTMFMAAGRMVQSKLVKVGDYYRIYGALLVKESSGNNNYVMYSDDFGSTWKVLGGTKVVEGGDEAKVEELPNGDIVLSSRTSGGRYYNVFKFTNLNNASGSWDSATKYSFAGDNSTNGELLLYPAIDGNGNRVNIIFQSLPIGKKTLSLSSFSYTDGRSDVAIYYKAFAADKTLWTVDDFTSDWTKGIHIDDDESAYSTMTILPDGNIGFLYEDEYSTSNAKGGRANIKFIPLTLSEITGGAYKNASYNVTLNKCTVGGEEMALATFSAPVSTLCPGGVSAYYIKDMNNGYAKLKAIGEGKTIPANTGVILAAEEAGSYTMTGVGDFVDATIGDNLLVGSSNSTVTFSNTVKGYILMGDGDGGVAFYSAQENTTLGKNKAYLKLDTPASSTGVRISFDGTTDIEFVEHEQEDAEPVIYDLYGRRVNEMQPGNIYIVNGKKILKK